MNGDLTNYRNILVAIDFSPDSVAALKHAVWIAKKNQGRIVLAHCLRDLRRVLESTPPLELIYGDAEKFQRELRRGTDDKLRDLAKEFGSDDLEIGFETLLGEPFVALIHAVQAEGYDLVMAGTRGLATWKECIVGGTAKRLIRKCPSSVWIVKEDNAQPPKAVLAATDFSEVSLKAVAQGLQVARDANADFHLVHVVDTLDVSEDAIRSIPNGEQIKQQIDAATRERIDSFLGLEMHDRSRIHVHVLWGTPWRQLRKIAEQVHADLVVMGTVGRSGIRGLLLGNTAEKVLGACPCSVLTVKPDNFVSPIEPAFWDLHPAIAKQPS